MHLSLIIPAFNEEDRIAATLGSAVRYLSNQSYESEIIVVDDGSTDGTSDAVRRDFPGVTVVRYEANRGKGYAVKTGMEKARGAYRVFYDADASTPIEELDTLWPEFDGGADIVIGSRSLPDSDVLVHQAWYRENMGRVFNRVLRLLRLTRFIDTQCGFKGFTAASCDVVFARQTVRGFAFDVELLYIAEVQRLTVKDVPVHWINSAKSSVNAVTDSARMIFDIFRIRVYGWMGRYAS